MAAEDNWQTKLQTIVERTAFIFNNEMLSDVKFVVPVTSGESESTKVIPAHKFVLAISSPVFFAMFYGQMAEPKDAIELPGCDYDSLLELFRFLYCDGVTLSESNVMQVIYLANKYMVPSLVEKCKEYLRNNLTAAKVFSILPYAQKCQDKNLEERCWKVIEMFTERAVTSDDFVTAERSVVESLVKREALSVTEVELFKAVDRWATEEGERQGLTLDGETKRRLLGEEIVKGIRFPLMSLAEFATVVCDTAILSRRETEDMIKYYGNVLKTPLSFLQGARKELPVFVVNRFNDYFKPTGAWNYNRGVPDRVHFSVNKPINLLGIQHFGSDGGEHTVSIKVKDTATNLTVVEGLGTFISEKDVNNSYYGFFVSFGNLIFLDANRKYELESLINGPASWHGNGGRTSVEAEGVQVTFSCAGDDSNGTTVANGQFPAFLFI